MYTDGWQLWNHIRRKETARFLVDELQKYYTVSLDWKGMKYIWLTIDWVYDRGEVHMLSWVKWKKH